ncbi:DUF397 domain-containing protein [Streptomyces sp. DSM 118878]
MTQETAWQKSSYSGGGDSSDCVELAAEAATIHLRESETPTAHLTTTPTRLNALIRTLKSGALEPRAQRSE